MTSASRLSSLGYLFATFFRQLLVSRHL